MKQLLTPYKSTGLNLKNHLVMAPMTRSRAIGNLPNNLMAEYYSQRNGAGLIVTEGTAPAPEALGYARIPGIFSEEQIEGWKTVTAAVHQNDTKIFLQLMHTGRIGHVANLPTGLHLVGASAIPAAGQIPTDTLGMQDYSVPEALSTDGVRQVIDGYVKAAENALAAGFDGVELHAANGYLMEQFLNPNVNNRMDAYGGTTENRAKFVVEITERTAAAIGKEKVGIRISPNSTLGDLQPYDADTTQETYIHLARECNRLKLAYVHISLNPQIPQETLAAIRTEFEGTLIYCNGFTADKAEQELNQGDAELIAFGRPFLANPDLEQRISRDVELNPVDFNKNPSVRYDGFGHTDVYYLADLPMPTAGPDEVLVKVKAAGINPGETSIREGLLQKMFPSTFPSGQGSDFAGIVETAGSAVKQFKPGDEVIGFSDKRSSHAEYVLVAENQLTPRPKNVSWEQAGSLFVAGTTGYAAIKALALQPGEVLVISAAAGGVGSLAVQLAKNAGAEVYGFASEANHEWLKKHGIVPVLYGDDNQKALTTALNGKTIDAFFDASGKGYVAMAVDMGVAKERINTIIDFEAAQKYGVKTAGSAQASTTDVLAELAGIIADGKLEMIIAATYPLAQVKQAFDELEQKHTHGKIVLIP